MSVENRDVGVDNNDSNSVSASISNNEESLDSISNDRCVNDGVIKQGVLAPSSLINAGSDEDSDKTISINDRFKAGKTNRSRKEKNENKPLFNITFRNQEIARGELLRNKRHHKVRSNIAELSRKRGDCEVFEEVVCQSTEGSIKRVDIVVINRQKNCGLVIDPTVRFERDGDHAKEVDTEKKSVANDHPEKYKGQIKKFLRDLIINHDPDTEEYDTSDMELDVWEEVDSVDSQDEIVVEDSSLFQVDTRPTLKDDLDVPAYSQKYREVLRKADESSSDKPKEDSALRTGNCFNCLGNHNLRDCPKPRNRNAIANNRQNFVNRKGTPNKGGRYHLDDEQRFGHFVPGKISSRLSKALGLAKHKLPLHIYRMRLLGYPPGWMEDAKVSHSGIMLYDSEGKEVADPDAEDGEIVTDGSRDKYDVKKLINYPGFNVPSSPGTIDESEYYNCPPQSFEHSKERMLSNLSQNTTKAYKRKRLAVLPTTPKALKSDEDLTEADMEVDEVAEPVVTLLPPDDNCRFIPPLPKDTPPRPPAPPSTESDSEGGETRSQGIASPLSTEPSASPRAQSPSLSDLETRKQLLLAELEDGGSSSDTMQKNTNPSTPVSTLGKVKSMDLGTPVLLSASPYSRLPNPEKFSRDICDVINFENLPDSTGKYEKMADLIRKVRTVVTKIQQDDDFDCDREK